MGIKPHGESLPTVKLDSASDRYGDLVTNLGSAGDIAGGVLNDISSKAQSANVRAGLLEDKQLQLNSQVEYLSGINGYCCAYQSLNIYTGKTEAIDPLGWINVWSPEERLLPFNKQLGPSKGAHVGEHGIKFEQEGLWTVYVLARRKNPSSRYDNPSSRLVAHITDESGEEYSTRAYQLPRFSSDYSLTSGDQRLSGRTYPNSDFSVSMAFPVVIPAPGYHVAVGVRDTDKTWWLGGTNYATLAVLKHDNRTENPGQTDVPNESV